ATADFAAVYVDVIAEHLAAWHPEVAEDFVLTAAGEAVLAVLCKPELYDPTRRPLFEYLCMAAQGDLRNALERERRHRHEQIPSDDVADGFVAGNYLGRDDDPALPLELAEDEALLEQLLADFTETERAVLQLMRDGERRTEAFVPLLDLE